MAVVACLCVTLQCHRSGSTFGFLPAAAIVANGFAMEPSPAADPFGAT